MNQKLLRQLYDCSVRAADVFARSALRPQSGNDLNDHFDLIRK
jgi:hypothetical protein